MSDKSERAHDPDNNEALAHLRITNIKYCEVCEAHITYCSCDEAPAGFLDEISDEIHFGESFGNVLRAGRDAKRDFEVEMDEPGTA